MACSPRLLFQLATEAALVLLLCTWGLRLFKSWLLYSGEDGQEFFDDRTRHPPVWNSQVYMEPEQETKYPIVIWWIPFSRTPRTVKTCKLGKCLFTHSRTEIDNPLTEDIIFYATGLRWDDLPLPRNPSHTWSLLHEESPKNAWGLTTSEAVALFNHTATCSRFSSYPLTTLSLNSLKNLMAPVKMSSHLKSKGEYGLVMYLQSSCDTPSDRDSYVSELMNYIVVDSYGSCLHNKDLPKHLRDPTEENINSADIIELMSKYKFVLTFENSICEDYITEKLWRVFEAGSIPVYKGSPSAKDWAPNDHSVIVIDEFSSPAHLAHYLLLLDEDVDEYNSYFDYKREGITNKRLLEHMRNRDWAPEDVTNRKPNFIQGFECHVCNSIHKRKSMMQGGKPPRPVMADKSHYRCPPLKPALQISSTSELNEYHGREQLNHWKRLTVCEEMKAKSAAKVINEGAGKEEMKKALEEVSAQCDSMEIPEDWMLNQYSVDEIIQTPVSIGMCKDLN